MLPGWFVLVSVGIRLISGGRYAWAVTKGRARPNPITWLLWGLTALIALAAQLQNGFSTESVVLLALAASPLLIFGISVAKQGIKHHLTPFTIVCGSLALLGIILWQLTAQPTVAIWFSIAADICATLPTLQKAYKDPSSEYAPPYLLSMGSMALTLLTIQTWTFTNYAFPLYILCINVALFVFAQFPLRALVQKQSVRWAFAPRE
ncbi:MAG TPA: hypothetical protein VFT87_00105 [Candidatus Saccharimonadales bacterium]|nr:hypothetical protein [Candidatus Saccharimonadales bacterium]